MLIKGVIKMKFSLYGALQKLEEGKMLKVTIGDESRYIEKNCLGGYEINYLNGDHYQRIYTGYDIVDVIKYILF
jgi:hypothetical protein